MLIQAGNSKSSRFHSIQEICKQVEQRYQPSIRDSMLRIESYLKEHPHIIDLPVSVSELVHLLFNKLQDELQHLFLKESGIIFPCITTRLSSNVIAEDAPCVQQKVVDTVLNTHQVIVQLVQRIRQLLHNYVTQPGWERNWSACVTEFFILETNIHRLIQFEQSQLYPGIMGQKS